MSNKKDYRFQIIGLDRNIRNSFLSICKMKGTSGSTVLKNYMAQYIEENIEYISGDGHEESVIEINGVKYKPIAKNK